MEVFVATARRLFETVPGSAAQRAANKWLIKFQGSPDAWSVALEVLQRSTLKQAEWTLPPSVLVVTMQMLRFKIAHHWGEITPEQHAVVRQTVMQWLTVSPPTVVSPPAIRVGCVMIADLVVKMHAHGWPQWHEELLHQLDEQRSPQGTLKLLEIYGAIPEQLQILIREGKESGQEAMTFQRYVAEIARVTNTALGLSDVIRECALRCIENWSVGCISTCPELGIDVSILAQSTLLSSLLGLATLRDELSATEIIADIFTSTPSDPKSLSPTIVTAVMQTIVHLQSFKAVLESSTVNVGGPDASDDDDVAMRWRSLAVITSAIAMHHAVAIFSAEGQEVFNTLQTAQQAGGSLPVRFLELVLACTAYPNADVAQPTLEFWFFLLDGSAHQGVQLQQLSSALTPDQLVAILSHLMNALIQQCRYPASFIEAQSLPDEGSDVENITNLRKEVGDTMLSLFAKWPTSPTTERGVACVKGMATLLQSSKDIATLDAVFFLLEYTIELFDIDSSASEDDGAEGEANPKTHSSNEGAQLLQQILIESLQLPSHPLLLSGIARFYQSLSKSVVLPGEVYIRVAYRLAQGLEMRASYSISAHALLSISKSIIQYTDVEERKELLQLLAARCQQLPASSPAAGDVVEATFRITHDLSESDFTAFCNAVLTPLTEQISSSDPEVSSTQVTLLGRAIGGVQSPALSVTLADQVWSLVGAAVGTHGESASFRECAVQYFRSAIVKNPSTALVRQKQVVEYCLQWFPHAVSAPTLECLSAVLTNEATHQEAFTPVVLQICETTLVACTSRLHFNPANDDTSNRTQMDELFVNEQSTELLRPEITEWFGLLRAVIRFFPSSLAVGNHLTSVLRISWLLLDVDHQVQDICDAVCDFLLDACSSQALLSSSPAVSDTLAAASPHLLRAVLEYFGPKRTHYKQRNLWQFLFQLFHAPRIAPAVKAHFHATMANLLVHERVLSPPLSPEQSESLAAALASTTQRPRFVALLTQTGKQVEAMPN